MGTDKSASNHRIQDYDIYFNKVTRRRSRTALRSYQKYVTDKYIYMAGGIPNADLFPITQIRIRLKDGRTLATSEDEMKDALQYGETIGLGPMVQWLIELQRRLHNPPTLSAPGASPSASDMELLISNGSQDALSRVMDAMLEEGDSILMEEATYSSVFNIFQPYGCKGIPIKNDSDGMKSCHLENVLSTWNEDTSGRRPRLLYCVPVGANPTGANWSLDRKREIYAVARKYDILILEDDPYYMLQFTKPLRPSLLALDEDGRVLRCDSFSKLMAAGARIGYLTGPRQFLEKIRQAMEISIGSANMLAQTIIWKVLQTIGHDGFIEHAQKTSNFYNERSKILVQFADKHLKGLAEWSPPAGGMFLWMKLLGTTDSKAVCQKLIERGAVFVNGSTFYPVTTDSPYIRISYSYASERDMDKSFQLLAEILREETRK